MEELKTLKVSQEIWMKIQQIKLNNKLSSVDEVISMLIKKSKVEK
jgi:hypothetical protein